MTEEEKRAAELLKMIEDTGKGVANIEIKSLGKVDLTGKQCAHLCKQVGVTFHDGLEDRVRLFRFTDTTVDRDGDVLMSKGGDLSEFKRDGVILGQHEGRKFPIGRALTVKFRPEEKDIVGKVLFFDDEIDRTGMSDTFFRFVDNGGMQGGSIGFDAEFKDVRKPSPEEKQELGMPEFGLIFDKWKLIEFSVVTLRANLNSERISKGKAWIKDMEFMRESGALSEDYLNKLRESEESTDTEDPKVDPVPTDGNVKLYITAADDQKVQDQKLKMAADMKEKGFQVEIIAYEEKASVTNVVGLTDDQKDAIVDALEAVDVLKEKFQNLLDMAGNENKNTSPGSPEGESEAEAKEMSTIFPYSN